MSIPFIRRYENATSNLILDEKMAREFTDACREVAESLVINKYPQILYHFTVDDVVGEVWEKVVRQDIGFDNKRNSTMKSFSYMLVSCKCIDMLRRTEKYIGQVSLDNMVSTSECNNDSKTDKSLMDMLSGEDTVEEVINEVSISDFISEMEELVLEKNGNRLTLSKILEYIAVGYKMTEISRCEGFEASDVSRFFNKHKPYMREKCIQYGIGC